jgi:hypothetical protein
VLHFGPRSAIERFFSRIDWRIKRFWESFSSRASVKSVENWAKAFAGFINLSKGAEKKELGPIFPEDLAVDFNPIIRLLKTQV